MAILKQRCFKIAIAATGAAMPSADQRHGADGRYFRSIDSGTDPSIDTVQNKIFSELKLEQIVGCQPQLYKSVYFNPLSLLIYCVITVITVILAKRYKTNSLCF